MNKTYCLFPLTKCELCKISATNITHFMSAFKVSKGVRKWLFVELVIAHLYGFGLNLLLQFITSNKLFIRWINAAVSRADDGNSPVWTAVFIAALTDELNTWVASLTDIFSKLLGFTCFSDSLVDRDFVAWLSISYSFITWAQSAIPTLFDSAGTCPPYKQQGVLKPAVQVQLYEIGH